ncbi:S-layer homology domain-containing protein [Intestinimonas sp. HCP28S3_D6]|uniref:S-layer homology domain-containing protein n=1 Tax=Intestinimonas sp. HCP28S3_D6 TaxID=3438942 RepID=UPI003F8AD7BA
MRNLKRALSLALAFVMVMSMMVVGAGAVSIDDFSDKDQIVNTEAVMTMVSLGVINGKDDGSYDPSGIVTRAEMAKLIAVTLNGGKDPTLGSITANFTDTKGHWAESYIAYVASLGIIDGRGDGTFGPNDQVTGAQAAKMILTMLGYRSDIEGFTGANWAINVQTKGNDIDLFADMKINPDEGLTRDDTAQMLYNGVQSWMVEYRNLEGSYDGVVYPQPLNKTKEDSTVLVEKFKVDKVEGVVEATSLISLDGTTTVAGKTRLTNVSINGGDVIMTGSPAAPADRTFPVDIDSSLLGQKVVLYVQGLNDLAPNAASSKVIGTPIVSQDNTVVTTTGRLAKASDVKDALKGSGIAVKDLEVNASGVVTGGGAAGVTITEDDTAKAGFGYTGTQGMPGVTQTFIDNNADGTVDYIIAKNPALAKINTYSESNEKLNISGIGSVDFVDVLNPKDVAQGDYVLVYNYDDTYVLEKATTVSGTVSAYTDNATYAQLSKITIDDVKYGQGSGKNLAPDVQYLDSTAPAALATTMQEMVDGAYTLYLDPNGNILGYVEDEGVIGNYAVITGVNSTGSISGFWAAEVKVILADGSTGKYDVNLLASANKFGKTGSTSVKEKAMYDTVMAMAGTPTLVSYALDGNTITLINPDASTQNYHNAYNTTSMTLRNSLSKYDFLKQTDNSAVSLMADNKTVFFVKDKDGNYSVVNGLNNLRANDLTTKGTSQAIYYQPAGSTAAAKAIYVEVTDSYTSNSNYAFVYSNYSSKTVNGETIYTYPVVLENGEISTVSSKTDKGASKSNVHEYQMSGEYVTFDNQTTYLDNGLQVTAVGNGSISVADADNNTARVNSYAVLSNAKIWNVEDVDAEDAKSVFETSFQKLDKVALVFDSDKNVKAAFVYDRVDGDLTAAPTSATLTVTGGSLVDDKGNPVTFDANGGTANWINAASSNTLQLAVTLNSTYKANQKIEVSIIETGTGSKATVANPGKGMDLATTTVYTAGALENGGVVTVKVNISEDGKATRVITYVVNVYNVSAEPTTANVEAPTKGAVDTAYNAKTVNLTADDAKTEWKITGSETGTKVQLGLVSTGTSEVTDVEVTGTLDADNARKVVFRNDGTLADVYVATANGEAGTLTLTVTTTDGAKVPVETKYTFVIGAAATYTLTIPGKPSETHLAGETVNLTSKGLTGTCVRINGATPVAISSLSSWTMPAQDVVLDDGYYAITDRSSAEVNGSGVSVAVTADKDHVKSGDTVTYTVTVNGTATKSGDITLDKLGGLPGLATKVDGTNCSMTGLVITITAGSSTSTSGTFTITGTVTATADADVSPTLTDSLT